MVCKKCGAEIPENQVFCSDCGQEVNLVDEYDMLDELIITPNITDHSASLASQNAVVLSRNGLLTGRLRILSDNIKKLRTAVWLMLLLVLSIALLMIINHINNSNSYEYQLEQAVKYYNFGNYRKSIKKAERAISLNDSRASAYLVAGDAYMQLQDEEGAVSSYISGLERDPDNRLYFSKLFDIFAKSNDYKSIRSYIDRYRLGSDFMMNYSGCFVDTPTADLTPGIYAEPIKLRLNAKGSAEEKLDIYYTINGEQPSVSSSRFDKHIELKSEGDYTIRAIAVNEYGITSDILTAGYSIAYPIPPSPVVTPGTGRYSEDTLIKVVTEEECEAYYSWDGSIPDASGKKYSLPVKMQSGSNTFTVVCINKYGKVSEPTVRSYELAETAAE